MGMAAIAAICPDEALKQLVAMVMGLVIFLIVGWSMRDLERAKQIRYVAAVAGIGFLLITLLFGQEYYGAKNWLVPSFWCRYVMICTAVRFICHSPHFILESSSGLIGGFCCCVVSIK